MSEIRITKQSMYNLNRFISIVSHYFSGQTDANVHQLLGGDFSLNSTGREQAAKVGRRLKDNDFTHAYVSDLVRARETMDIILAINQHWQDKWQVIFTGAFDCELRSV